MILELKQLCANYSSRTGTERAKMFVTLHCVLHNSNSRLVTHSVHCAAHKISSRFSFTSMSQYLTLWNSDDGTQLTVTISFFWTLSIVRIA